MDREVRGTPRRKTEGIVGLSGAGQHVYGASRTSRNDGRGKNLGSRRELRDRVGGLRVMKMGGGRERVGLGGIEKYDAVLGTDLLV